MPTPTESSDHFRQARHKLVELLRRRGIRDERVLAAMERVPREMFLPPELADEAYVDTALPIDCQQTISQPIIVAMMTEALELSPGQ
jgi:protein-L-isoaspartate(D-aspartate) O-methyltransferase